MEVYNPENSTNFAMLDISFEVQEGNELSLYFKIYTNKARTSGLFDTTVDVNQSYIIVEQIQGPNVLVPRSVVPTGPKGDKGEKGDRGGPSTPSVAKYVSPNSNLSASSGINTFTYFNQQEFNNAGVVRNSTHHSFELQQGNYWEIDIQVYALNSEHVVIWPEFDWGSTNNFTATVPDWVIGLGSKRPVAFGDQTVDAYGYINLKFIINIRNQNNKYKFRIRYKSDKSQTNTFGQQISGSGYTPYINSITLTKHQ